MRRISRQKSGQVRWIDRWIDREEGAKLGTLALTIEVVVDRTLERRREASQTWVLRAVVLLPVNAV